MGKKLTVLILLSLISIVSFAQEVDSFDAEIRHVLANHFEKYKKLEYFSGAELSIYLPKNNIKNYYIGTISHDKNSQPVGSNTLFHIGSITKSFTAAMILQLEKEGKITIEDTLKKWLPNYSAWGALSIKSLLNMSSGLPNYSDTPAMNYEEAKDLGKQWSSEELISYVYPVSPFQPPLKQGYFYTNTGYVLTDLIIEKLTQHTFREELIARTIKPANLNNTFYPIPSFEPGIHERLAHGYNYNQYDNPMILGKDIVENNLSWAAAAGGIVSNSEDIIKWIKNLFIEQTILDNSQKQTMQTLISLDTGKSIAKPSKNDPHGFGLGIVNAYDASNPLLKNYWFYEGQTLGFRAVYIYTPCNGVIISSIFNSATNSENDHLSELMKNINKSILKYHPELLCH